MAFQGLFKRRPRLFGKQLSPLRRVEGRVARPGLRRCDLVAEVVYQRTRSLVNTTLHITGPVTHGLSDVLQAMTAR